MKKALILFLILLSGFAVTAQGPITIQKNEPVKFDSPYLKFSERKNIVYVIKGYNPFATKVNGKGESLELTAYSVPGIFKDITAALQVTTDSVDQLGVKNHHSEFQHSKPPEDPEKDLQLAVHKQKFLENYSAFIKTFQAIHALHKADERILAMMQDPAIDSVTLNKNISGFLKSIAGADAVRDKIGSLLKEADSYFGNLKMHYEAINNNLETKNFTFKGKLTDEKNETSLEAKDITLSVKRNKLFEEEFNQASTRIKLLNTDSIRTAIIYKVNQAADLQAKAETTPFIMTYEPGNDIKDIRKDSIRIENLKGELIQSYGPYVFHTKGQLKVDVSAGYLLSFKGDDNYTITQDSTGKRQGIKKGNSDQLTHSIGVLFHAYWKFKGDVSVGPTAGFSIPLENNVNFYLGGSLLFNGKSRFIISAGVAATKVKELNMANLKGSSNGHDYDYINEYSTYIIYDKVYRFAPFVGITYNLVSIK